MYSLQKKIGILGLAPLHSQKHGYGPRRQRQLRCSCFAEQCRGTGRGCVELVVKETVEEPTDGVQGTFLCVFNAVKRDGVRILYIWEDVKFQVTFGMLRLSSHKDFWNKQEKKMLPGMCIWVLLSFLLSMEGGRRGRSTSWVRDPLGNGNLRTLCGDLTSPQVLINCVWSSRGRWDNNWWDVLLMYPMVIC